MTKPSRRWCLWLLVAAALAPACVDSVPATERPATARLIERSRVTMGSLLTLTAWTADEPAAVAAFETVFDEFDRLDALMSVWKEGSDIVRLNQAAGQRPVSVHDDVRSVLQAGIQVGDWTGGKFDITFAALADVWKFNSPNLTLLRSTTGASLLRARLPHARAYRPVRVKGRHVVLPSRSLAAASLADPTFITVPARSGLLIANGISVVMPWRGLGIRTRHGRSARPVPAR